MTKAVLVAHSDESDQKEFENIFKPPDYHFIISDSDDDTLLQIKLFKPDLIISGARPKKEVGLELCNQVKDDPEIKHIPFALVLNIFEEISERDRERFRIDGIIYKPFQEDETLNVAERLIEGEVVKVKEREISETEMEWKSFEDNLKSLSGMKEGASLDMLEDIEEEIIDLVEVVEEPEPKMSINDFLSPAKEEPFEGITPLESWGNIEEVKPLEKGFILFPEGDEKENVLPSLREKATDSRDSSSEDLLEKMDLKEILEKMDQLEPSPPLSSFEEFEAALQKKGGAKSYQEEMQPFVFEEPEVNVSEKITLPEKPFWEVPKALPEDEFSEELMEEIEEEDISIVDEPKEIIPKEIGDEEFAFFKSTIFEKEASPPTQGIEKQMEEVISKRVQEMMEEFTAKLIPEVTQNIINLTIEKIEKVVREAVPDIAEKAIQEEIKRLQKGDKE